jgi:hypothetical protein
MTRAWIGSDHGDQLTMLPLDARDLLPAEHQVWDVLELVGADRPPGATTAYAKPHR